MMHGTTSLKLYRIYGRYIFNTVLWRMQSYTSAASQNIMHDSLITTQRGPNISDVNIKTARSVPHHHHHSTPTSVDVSRLFASVCEIYPNTTQRCNCIRRYTSPLCCLHSDHMDMTHPFQIHSNVGLLAFWRRNYFFLILAHPVYKMWIIQEPNMLDLWNKLHFKEEKMESIYHV